MKNTPDFLAKLFDEAAKRPVISLIILLAVQTVFTLDSRALWFSDEVRHVNVFEHLINHGNWWVLHLNGEPYPDKPPVYFWFLSLLYPVFLGKIGAAIMMGGAALSGLLYILATYFMARRVTGADKPAALASSLAVLTGFYFLGLLHYSRMDLFFATLIVLAQVYLFLGLAKDEPNRLTILGFVLVGLAGLTKGQFGVAYPVITAIAHLAWTGRLRRAVSTDFLGGLGLSLVILASWAAGIILIEGLPYLQALIHKQIYQRSLETWHHYQPFWHYAVTLPLVMLPWSMTLLAVPWRAFLSRPHWTSLAEARRDNPGRSYVWICAITGFTILSVMSMKIVVYLLPIFAPLGIIMARNFLRLPDAAKRRVVKGMAATMAVAGILMIVANHGITLAYESIPSLKPLLDEGGFIYYMYAVRGVDLLGLILLGGGWLILKAGTHSTRSVFAAVALVMALFSLPAAGVTAPSLDPLMSTRNASLALGDFCRRGYAPIAYDIYSGIFTHYAGQNIPETKQYADVAKTVADNPKAVVIMQKKHWKAWEERPQSLRIITEFWIVDRPYVLATKG